jgi:tetratricopeptide (TPR) repeat protein
MLSPETILDTDVKVEDIGLIAKATRSFLRAQLAFDNKDTEALDKELSWLASKVLSASLIVDGDGIALCATGNSRYAPTQNDINNAEVVMAQIKGMKALLEGNESQFESYMQAAVELENQTNFPAGPPKIIKPSFEQYGEWLLTKEKYDEALNQFEKALKRMPRRSKSLMGKMVALAALDQESDAQLVQNELELIWKNADGELVELIKG